MITINKSEKELKGTTITSIRGREILDSRGNPTIEVEVKLVNGTIARAASPSGASTGSHEAVELRDRDSGRYGGKGVLQTCLMLENEIAPLLTGMDVMGQDEIDEAMISKDGTPNKQRFGANTIIAISMAVARARALCLDQPLYRCLCGPDANLLPVPMMNVLNGGVHANWLGPDFQEYMIVPYGASNFHEALRWGAETYQSLKMILKRDGFNTAVGDEGGYVIKVTSNDKPIDLILEAIEEAGYQPKAEIGIALDPAASEFYQNGRYILRSEVRPYRCNRNNLVDDTEGLTSEELVDRYSEMIKKYPIISIEDGLAEDDWDGWRLMNRQIGRNIELVGDDLFVTNVERIKRGIVENVANSVLIKPNQIGTVTETLAAVTLAQQNGWGVEVSHRSGETVDTFIADLSVAIGSGHLKTGAPARGERVEKYNQLMRIEEELGDKAKFAGRSAFIN
ncbi:MAG: phosphopyruvate hydratase [Methanomassiliicoccales archaeon]|jgi:enolase